MVGRPQRSVYHQRGYLYSFGLVLFGIFYFSLFFCPPKKLRQGISSPISTLRDGLGDSGGCGQSWQAAVTATETGSRAGRTLGYGGNQSFWCNNLLWSFVLLDCTVEREKWMLWNMKPSWEAVRTDHRHGANYPYCSTLHHFYIWSTSTIQGTFDCNKAIITLSKVIKGNQCLIKMSYLNVSSKCFI